MVSVLVPVFCYRKVSLELVVNDFTSLSVEHHHSQGILTIGRKMQVTPSVFFSCLTPVAALKFPKGTHGVA